MMNTEPSTHVEKSNDAHVSHNDRLFASEGEKRMFILKNKDNAEYMINTRTLNILNPFLKDKNTWLTVGDYNGFEAKYLAEHHQDVLASDISNGFLKAAQAEGLIEKITQENVEKLSFENDSFDYTMCREAYHHFPRAYLGAYEMIRVARNAAIIIEPVDILQKMPLILWLKNVLDIISPTLINKVWKNRFSFEVVGNYVFKISEREVEKMAMGIGLPCIAFKKINVVLDNTGEGARDTPYNKKVWNRYMRKVTVKNILAGLHIVPYNTLCSVIFKKMPSQELINELKSNGYTVLPLPKNPYLK